MILASYVLTAVAFLAIGIAIGRRRDAKVRDEIAQFGAMVIEAMKEKTKGNPHDKAIR